MGESGGVQQVRRDGVHRDGAIFLGVVMIGFTKSNRQVKGVVISSREQRGARSGAHHHDCP